MNVLSSRIAERKLESTVVDKYGRSSDFPWLYSHLSAMHESFFEEKHLRHRAAAKVNGKALSEKKSIDLELPDKSHTEILLSNSKKLLNDNGPSVQKLTIPKTYGSDILSVVSDQYKNLKHLIIKFKEYHHNDFHNAFSHMKELKRIDIYKTHGTFNGNCLQSLPKHISSIALTRLNNENRNDTPDLLPLTFEKFEELVFLRLDGYNLTKDVIKSISKKISLLYLRLNHCLIIDDLSLLTNLIDLEVLSLKSVQTVNNKFLSNIAANCELLIHLDISGCKNFDDDGLIELAKLKFIETLCVNDTNITDEPLKKFINLINLECSNCKNIKDLGICKLLLSSTKIENITADNTSVTEFINGLMQLYCFDALTRIDLTKVHLTTSPSIIF